MLRRVVGLLLFAGLVPGLAGTVVFSADEPATEPLPAEDRDFFEKQVRPVLVKRCLGCHGGTKAGGGLSLETAAGWKKGGESGPAIVAGKPDESLLVDAINYRSLEMPPASKGGRLPPEEIAILTTWVTRGAPDPRDGRDTLGGMSREEAAKWWAFQPLAVVEPAAEMTADVQRIDALIQKGLDQQALRSAPEADRRTGRAASWRWRRRRPPRLRRRCARSARCPRRTARPC